MVLMLAVANTFPSFALPARSPDITPQSEAGTSLAVGETLCLNCSGLTTASLVESTASSQLTSQSLGNSPIMVAPGWIQSDEEDAWVWRGKVKSRWESVGFDSGIFELFMRMKGARTRLSLLDALSVPKDRMQLAQELGLDWKAIDYQIVRLNRCGLVRQDRAFGRVKLYRLTTLGESLLRLLEEFNGQIEPDAREVLESVSNEAPPRTAAL
jgi:DNA-binding transcriptional ArsR family regulator